MRQTDRARALRLRRQACRDAQLNAPSATLLHQVLTSSKTRMTHFVCVGLLDWRSVEVNANFLEVKLLEVIFRFATDWQAQALRGRIHSPVVTL